MPEVEVLIHMPNPVPFQSYPSTLVAQAKSHTSSLICHFLLPPYPINQQVLLMVFPKSIPNPSTSPHLHCNHHGLN